ncbi:protein DMR6-LIKE OXYGENASE 2-like [Impatiens glandulifera]|uniref:protein DMR6-LIKE OXYGENASE 2-like n=1 Tax=Impatiens glandulifera TaxID=253017 RepID=UPI001FB141FC|nr:protein DMR6-LIKE OXYGENASE 2-like [Impatiens glandulifera]
MGEVVDPSFIQSIEHRPNLDPIEAQGIPIIDLSPANSPTDALVAAIGEASQKWGFFQVINHGVPAETRRKLEWASREFFSLSKEEKLKVKRDDLNPQGYYDAELTKNVRDWKEVFDFTTKEPTIIPNDSHFIHLVNRWPQHPPNFREIFEEYTREVEKLAYKLLELISLSLGLAKDRLNGFFSDKQTSFIRLNHYPPCPFPDLALGVGRHKDGGALTILAQDNVAGLEVKRKTDGEWIRVKPDVDSYIINIGDIIQVWSNDKYESVEHRVIVNMEKERFSMPFFFNPGHHINVVPLEEEISLDNPVRYKAYNWGKFFATRKMSNFVKLKVENIQISQFKIVEGA